MENNFWKYFPKWLGNGELLYNNLLPILFDQTNVTQLTMYGKKVNIPRRSCVYILKNYINPNDLRNVIYKGTNIYTSDETPDIISEINNLIGSKLNLLPDYVLCHIYRNGQDYINWHNDDEAMNSDIISISLSDSQTSRKFRLRPKEWTKSYEHEIDLYTGDMVLMYGPNENNNMTSCQEKYKHTIVKITGKKGENTNPRINLTFRFLEQK